MHTNTRARNPGLLIAAFAFVTMCAGISPVYANTVDLSRTPPDQTVSVDPNIVVTFDDSGSMASDFMGDTRPFDNGAWGNPWRCAGVIDPRPAVTTDPAQLNLMRTHSMNGVYYNPNNIYAPAVFQDNTSFNAGNFNSAGALTKVWNDGVTANRPVSPSGTTSFTDFTGVKTGTTDKRWKCTGDAVSPLDDNGGPYYYRFKTGINFLLGTGKPDPAILYNAANWEVVKVLPAEYNNWANWYSYYRTRNLMTRTSLSRVFGKLADNVRVAYQNINDGAYLLPASTIITKLNNTNAAAPNYRTGFFNWIFQTGASGTTPDRAATIRAGDFFKRGTPTQFDLKNPYFEPAATGIANTELSCRQNFHMLVTDGFWNESDPTLPTPMRPQNTTVTLPDSKSYTVGTPGTASPTPKVSSIYWNVAGTNYASSLSNIAFNYWASDLRADLADNVAPFFSDKTTGITGSTALPLGADPRSNDEIYFNPANDPASWQHVVQFMITLGVDGSLESPEDLLALRNGTKQWPKPVNNAVQAIDDTWHAAVNSRGSYFSATEPQALVDHLTDILNSILLRRGSASALSVSASVLTNGALAYSTGYDTSDWSGYVNAYVLNLDGTRGAVKWDASCILTGGPCLAYGTPAPVLPARDPTTREILTSKTAAGTGAPFRWGSLSTAQQAWLNINPETLVADALGQKRADFIRGDRTQESTTPLMRKRTSVLGAVINSSSIFVGAPASGIRDTFPAGSQEALADALTPRRSYERFAFANRNRTRMVYAGANDGMLHGFRALDGVEMFAYVPYEVSKNLNTLTRYNNFKYQPFVDIAPKEFDVFTPDPTDTSGSATVLASTAKWRTILVGSLRMGGRGVYALDITDPATVTESNAGSKVLWEFSSSISGGDNLGYTFGTPNVVRSDSGKWVVLVPGGYFPTRNTSTPDDPNSLVPAASNTYSSLFVLDAQNGKLIRELKTPAGILSYGLSTVAVGDYTGDQISDFAVGGDLVGNLWRFNLGTKNPSNVIDWTVERIFKPATNGAQPITVMPQTFPDPISRQVMVVFGTGKYLGLEDRTTVSVAPVADPQSFYGIREYGLGSSQYPAALSDLVKQTLTINSSTKFRSLTDNPVPVTKKGWYFNLTLAGERNVLKAAPLVSTLRAVLVTMIPGGNDPCKPDRSGAVLVVDTQNGGPADGTPPVGSGGALPPGSTQVVGTETLFPPLVGDIPVVTQVGGGRPVLPGLTPDGVTPIAITDSYWRRRSWRDLFDDL
jgi:type IV pilus assembly protein PilY1